MKKHIKFILIPVLILVLILPMVVFGEQGKRRAGAEEVTETTEQVSEESSDKNEQESEESSEEIKQTTESSTLETLASSELGKKETKETQTSETKKSKKKETKLPKPRAGVKPIDGAMTLAEHKAEYGAIYQQSNEDYNTAHGFDPLAKAVEVDTYSSTTSSANPYGYGFIEALKDESITKITLLNNIESPANIGTISLRKNSIEIDGRGFELLLNNGGFGFDTPSTGENPVFHLHDVICLQKADAMSPGATNDLAFVGNNNIVIGVNKTSNKLMRWSFRFGNIETKSISQAGRGYVSRLRGLFAAVDQCAVTLYGYNFFLTNTDTFHLGSLNVEPNTIVTNRLIYCDTFPNQNIEIVGILFKKQEDDATGVDGEFKIGKNGFVFLDCKMQGDYNRAPYFVYSLLGDYSEVLVEEDAWFNSYSVGPTFTITDKFSLNSRYEVKKFHAKQNAKINFSPQNSSVFNRYSAYQTAVLFFDSPTYKVKMDFYFEKCEMVNFVANKIFGSPKTVYVQYHNGKIIIDTPKLYGIGSFVQGPNAYWAYFNRNEYLNSNNQDSELLLKNVDVSRRRQGTASIDKIDYAETLNHLPSLPSNLNNINSSNPTVQTAVKQGSSLVTNGGKSPSIAPEYITDAQKTYRVKVQAGRLFTGLFDEHGMPIFEEGTITGNDKVDFLDTRNNNRNSISIGVGNYASYTDTEFQIADKEVIATLKTAGTKVSETKTTVLDVTPPAPIRVTGDKITVKDTQLTAKVEANAKVFIAVNDGTPVAAGTADGNGDWSYTIPGGGYSEGDKIQIFLEDTTAALPGDFDQTGLEDTRTTGGNRNPKDGDVTYKDATFKQATIYHVEKGIQPIKFHIRQMAVSPSVPIEEIVTPKNGYVTLKNTNDVKFDMQVKSGVESTGTPSDSQEAPFKDVSLLIPDPDTNKFLDLSAVIPSNYEYAGYAVTDTNVNHPFSSANTGTYQFDYSGGVYEKWITIFIKPNRGSEDTVGFYHWDYELNKFGKIK